MVNFMLELIFRRANILLEIYHKYFHEKVTIFAEVINSDIFSALIGLSVDYVEVEQ